MTQYEIEQKYRVKNPSKIRKLLSKLKAKKHFSKQEFNDLFDRKNELFKKRCVLRLRHYGPGNRKAISGEGKDALLTFKGPRIAGRFKKRIEWQTKVDQTAMREILRLLGYAKKMEYRKTREEYRLGKATITLDHLKGHGWFVEIEAKAALIHQLQKKLGLSNADREERTYLEMLNPRFKD